MSVGRFLRERPKFNQSAKMIKLMVKRANENRKQIETQVRTAGLSWRALRTSDALLVSILLLLCANLYFNSYALDGSGLREKTEPSVTNINLKLTNHWGNINEKSLDRSTLDVANVEPQVLDLSKTDFSTSFKIIERNNFAHGPKGKGLRAYFMAIRNTCCWFHIKQLKAYRKLNFETQLIKYDSVRDINQRTAANMGMLNNYDVWICLARYECWNQKLYEALEGKTKTNKILFVKQVLSTKNNFCLTVRKALRTNTAEGLSLLQSFTFDCYVLPQNYQELQTRAANNKDMKWIIKPQASQAGAGIFVRNAENIVTLSRNKEYVVQPFLKNPLLLDNRKFDLRLHVTITSLLPLRAYMHEFGITRFAAHEYDRDATNGGKKSQFLTNISVNNKIKKTDELTWLLPQLKKELGDKAALIFERIEKSMAMVLVASEKIFKEKYMQKVSSDFECKNCYQKLGMDVILDENLNAYIIEINGHPTEDFTAEKLNEGARNMNVHLADMLFKNMKKDVSEDLLNDLSKVAGTDDLDTEFSWLDEKQREYLIASKKEQEMLGEYRRIYPPTIVSDEIQAEWERFFEHLQVPESRIRFHKLLVELQKLRVGNCLRYEQECSNEVKDRCQQYQNSDICDMM